MDMKSMKISNRRILPLLFLTLLIASCAKTPQSISYGHDTCSLCHGVIENQADYQHPGHMLNAYKSYYKLNDHTNGFGEKLTALRHDRANSLCWKELKTQILEQSEYLSQNSAPTELDIQNYR